MAARPPSPSSSDDPPRPTSSKSSSPLPSPSASYSEPSSTSNEFYYQSLASRGRSLVVVSTLEGEVTPGEAEPDETQTNVEVGANVGSSFPAESCYSEVSSSNLTGSASSSWAPDSSQNSSFYHESGGTWPPLRSSPSTPSSSSWVNHSCEATVSRSTWHTASPVGPTSSLSSESFWSEMEGGDVTSTGPPEVSESIQSDSGDVASTTSSWFPSSHPNSTQESGARCPTNDGAWGGYDLCVPPQCTPEAGMSLNFWRSRATLSLTRVTPTTPPPRPPTPPRQSTSPAGRTRALSQPLRQSVSPPPRTYHHVSSPSGMRRSLSPPTYSNSHTPIRRSSSPVPLSAGHVQLHSPGARPRLSPRPRSARTPSPRPPRPPVSANDLSNASTSQQFPRPHYNKMRGR